MTICFRCRLTKVDPRFRREIRCPLRIFFVAATLCNRAARIWQFVSVVHQLKLSHGFVVQYAVHWLFVFWWQPQFVIGRRAYDNWLVDNAFHDDGIRISQKSAVRFILHSTLSSELTFEKFWSVWQLVSWQRILRRQYRNFSKVGCIESFYILNWVAS